MNNIRKYIITGVISIIPLALTYWLIKYLFMFFSEPGKYIVDIIFKYTFINKIPFIMDFYIYFSYLIGFLLTILFLFIVGAIISNVFGKRLYMFFESILNKIPIVNKVYQTIKQITNTFTKDNSKAFQKVVLIEYPKDNLWTLAMVSGETYNKDNEKCYKLFVPTTPNPTSGYLILIKSKDAIETNISVEEAMEIIISAGMISPDKFNI
tara:strand:- start:14100 stop:14726 length:627 start_codon:yes stop_codon:yes gene_type:complete